MKSIELASFAGVSLRQLQWWDERGIVQPRQHQHSRFYSPAQIWQVTVMASLRRKGITHLQMRRFLKLLKPMSGYLVTDGKAFAQSESLAGAATRALKFKLAVVIVETVKP